MISEVEVRAELHDVKDGAAGPSLHAVSKPSEEVRLLLARDYLGFTETGPVGHRWIEPPQPVVTLILNISEAFGGFPDAFVVGIADKYAIVESQGGTSCIDLKLTPWGAFTMLGVPMKEIAGRVIDFREVIGPGAQAWLDSLREASTWDACFAVLDALLVRRVTLGPRPADRVLWAWHRLVGSGGQLRISHLADEVGWSGKHLIEMFKEQIGLAPKTAARVIRFHGLLRRLDDDPLLRLVDAAADFGYSDQSHLLRDFRRFIGETPGEYVRRIKAERAASKRR
jgi:AraC-like DNA-binding protein